MALSALAWIMSDDGRARRFLDLTGLTPETLRASLAERETHRAVLEFLCSHEPDLLAASEELMIEPAELAAARQGLER
jgi:hypothetical protein